MPVDLLSALDVLQKLSNAGLLLLVLWGGYKRRWVWGWQYDAVVVERDHYKSMVFRLLETASRATTAVERIVNGSDKPKRAKS